MYELFLNQTVTLSGLTVASFLSFKRQQGVFWAFRPEDKVKHSNDFRLTGSEPEIYRRDQPTEIISVFLRISGSLLNVDLSFIVKKRTQLLNHA